MDGFPFAMIHSRGEGACGGIAFYLRAKPLFGDMLNAADARFPNGTHPEHLQIVRCGSCGKPMPEPPMLEDVTQIEGSSLA